MIALTYDTARDAYPFDPSDAADITPERDDYVRLDIPGSYRVKFGFVEAVYGNQVLVCGSFGVLRWVTDVYVTVVIKHGAQ